VFDKGAGDSDKEGSSGLGLAIVKTFVEAHNGTVHVQSVEGEGATISFALPLGLANRRLPERRALEIVPAPPGRATESTDRSPRPLPLAATP
jgi:hypothetical protein